MVDGLVENQILMLHLMKENPRVSKREMAESVGISTTAIDKNIARIEKERSDQAHRSGEGALGGGRQMGGRASRSGVGVNNREQGALISKIDE